MGRTIPFDMIQKRGTSQLTEGFYLAGIETLQETESSTGKCMYNAVLRIEEPRQFAGIPLFENFTVGTKEDAAALDPATWGTGNIGAERFLRMLDRAGVPLTDPDSDVICALAVGKKVVVDVVKKVEAAKRRNPQTGVEEDNRYAGRVRNEINEFYAVGERNPGDVPTRRITGGSDAICPRCGGPVALTAMTRHLRDCPA